MVNFKFSILKTLRLDLTVKDISLCIWYLKDITFVNLSKFIKQPTFYYLHFIILLKQTRKIKGNF